MNDRGTQHVTPSSDRDRTTALVLCVVLGWIGGHQFYVGRIGTGLLYACTFGLFGIGWAADFVALLLGTFRDNVGQPLR